MSTDTQGDIVGSVGPRAGEVLAALRRIIRAIDLHSQYLVGQYGLTGPQLSLLRRLESAGQPMSIGRLAAEIHVSQATATGIVDRLERKGLVCRRQGETDRRTKWVSLTPTARATLAKTPPMLQEHFVTRFQALEDWEQMQMLASLQRVVAMMEASDLDATPMLATGPINAGQEETGRFLGQRDKPTSSDESVA